MHIETRRFALTGMLSALLACEGKLSSAGGIDAGGSFDAGSDTGIARDAARRDAGDAGPELPDLPLAEQAAVCRVLVQTLRTVTSAFAQAECSEAARAEPRCEASRDACVSAREAQYAELYGQFDCEDAPQQVTEACFATRREFDGCVMALTSAYTAQAQRVTCSTTEPTSAIPPPAPCAALKGLCDDLARFAP